MEVQTYTLVQPHRLAQRHVQLRQVLSRVVVPPQISKRTWCRSRKRRRIEILLILFQEWAHTSHHIRTSDVARVTAARYVDHCSRLKSSGLAGGVHAVAG